MTQAYPQKVTYCTYFHSIYTYFHLYKMSRIVKPSEPENRLAVAGAGGGRNGGAANWHAVARGVIKHVLELTSRDGYTTL